MLLGNLINTRLYSIDGQLDAFLSINNPAIPRGKPNGNSPWNQANRFSYRLRRGMNKVVICLSSTGIVAISLTLSRSISNSLHINGDA